MYVWRNNETHSPNNFCRKNSVIIGYCYSAAYKKHAPNFIVTRGMPDSTTFLQIISKTARFSE